MPKKVLNRKKLVLMHLCFHGLILRNNIIGKRLNNLKHPALIELFNSNGISKIWSNSNKRKLASESLFIIYILDKWLESHG